jgi:hypothetical protein
VLVGEPLQFVLQLPLGNATTLRLGARVSEFPLEFGGLDADIEQFLPQVAQLRVRKFGRIPRLGPISTWRAFADYGDARSGSIAFSGRLWPGEIAIIHPTHLGNGHMASAGRAVCVHAGRLCIDQHLLPAACTLKFDVCDHVPNSVRFVTCEGPTGQSEF